MDRAIPYYQDVILPDTIAANRTVLIASSENAIRGLLMHLCDIPQERISQVEIPTGVPLIYDMEGRCLHLLDDGLTPKPRDRYDFGTAADLLFRPCDYDDCACAGENPDPHIYLDGNFYDDRVTPAAEDAAVAEREAWERVIGLKDAEEEFTTEVRDFWSRAPRPNAKDFDDEPAEVEI